MASISTDPSGNVRVQFVGTDSKRRTVRLGKMNKKNASAVKLKVEHLITAAITRTPLDTDTARWVASIGDDLAGKLAAVGLVPERPKATTVAALIQAYRDIVAARQKPASQTVVRTIANDVLGHFNPSGLASGVSSADAEAFKDHLQTRGLAPATVSRRLRFVRTIFAFGVKRKLIPANPFADVSAVSVLPKERRVYVPASNIVKVMGHANPTWRTILALTRFAGLRCPSEVVNLKWEDVNLADGIMTVTAPKTERYPGKGYRAVPIFGNLRPHLEEAWELAAPGTVYVVSGPQGDVYRAAFYGPNGAVNANLRTAFGKLIRRSGLIQWPRLFNTLRASCETDLLDAGLNPKAVTEWLGHSLTVAMLHYARVHEGHYKQAQAYGRGDAKCDATPVQNATQTVTDSTSPEMTNATETLLNKGFRRVLSVPDYASLNAGMDDTGFEPVTPTMSM